MFGAFALSWLLAVILCVGVLPGTVYAAPADEDVKVAVTYGDDVSVDTSGGTVGGDVGRAGAPDGGDTAKVLQAEWESYVASSGGYDKTYPRADGKLVIQQDMGSVEEGSFPFTTVYQVDAELGGKTVYSNAVGIKLESADDVGTDKATATVEGIPQGASVAVRLAYAGPVYSRHSDCNESFEFEMDEGGTTVKFLLAYDFRRAAGDAERNSTSFPKGGGDAGSVVLPDTGGVGVGWSAFIGTVCVAVAAVMWFRRKEAWPRG